eukprot:scaffold1395_cov152-Amphora_coffeaeformis.AAC.11
MIVDGLPDIRIDPPFNRKEDYEFTKNFILATKNTRPSMRRSNLSFPKPPDLTKISKWKRSGSWLHTILKKSQ